MTSISTATADWLALRARADDRSRSAELARLLARSLHARPAPLVLHDLGAGTGSMTRWLAPFLPGPQHWMLRDGDAGILAAVDLGVAVDASGLPIEADAVVEDLAHLPEDAFHGAAAVTASALLDVVTGDEAARIVAACVSAGTPALFSLSVTGVVRLRPSARRDPAEDALAAAFNDHQRRDADGRRMLGPDAVRTVAGFFAEAGWHVRTVATPWHLDGRDDRLVSEWLDGWIEAAVEQRPELAAVAEECRSLRGAQAAARRLRVTVSHEDLLAWPR